MKYRKSAWLILGASLISLAAGCSALDEKPEKKSEKVVQEVAKENESNKKEKEGPNDAEKLVQANMEAAEKENFEVYMGTLSKAYQNEESQDEIRALFENFDIDYEVLESKVIKEETDEVTIEVKQKAVAKKVAEGLTFQNHIAVAQHTLVKEDGKWVFGSTEVISTEYLNEN